MICLAALAILAQLNLVSPTCMDQGQVVAALRAERWTANAAQAAATAVPVVLSPGFPHGFANYYGTMPPVILAGTHDTWSGAQMVPHPPTLSHEYRHWWQDKVLGVEGADLEDIRAATRALAASPLPTAAAAARRTMEEHPEDVVHWDHYVWTAVDEDISRLPIWYAEERMGMMDLTRAGARGWRVVLPWAPLLGGP